MPQKFSRQQAIDLHQKAHEAGLAAMAKITPVPMLVGSPTHPLGSDIDPAKPVYRISGGICGVGTIKMPATSSFAREMVKAGLAMKSSGPGIRIYIRAGDQSYEFKCAYAGAYVEVLRESGIERVYADVRVD